VNSVPSPSFPVHHGERPGLALLDRNYFDGPGEELWSGSAVDREPDPWWDAPGEDRRDGQPWSMPTGTRGGDWPEGGYWPQSAAKSAFAAGGPAERMAPGVPLSMLVEQAIADELPGMPDDAVIGAAAAARRLRSRAEWLELKATEEFARRRWESDPVPVRDKNGRWRFNGRDAEFAADELAFQLTESPLAAQERMDLALALRDRLPAMAGQLAAGRIDGYRCQLVHDVTSALADEHARQADAQLAPEAPGLRYDGLRRRARKLAMMLDPESERERKERATRKKARVEAFPEKSGNYALAGRELPIEEVLASRAHVRGLAQELRARGVPGSLRELELTCYLDLTQGRDPRDRIPGQCASGDPGAVVRGKSRDDCADGECASGEGGGEAGADGRDAARAERDAWLGRQRDEDLDDEADDGEPEGAAGGSSPWPFSPPGSGGPGGRAAFPAKINLLVPVGTLLGWSTMPGEAGRDIIDPKTLRDLVQAASHHPATRWCVTIVGADQTAVGHGCARGQHPWDPPPGEYGIAPGPPAGPAPRPPNGTPSAVQLDQLATLLQRLKAGLSPIATDSCDHRHREDRYRPSRVLGDLVRARNATCPAPGCGASSVHCDLDHTKAWPDGDTDECNLGPPCRHHHRLKQVPGWNLVQPQPGSFSWTTPAGRVYHVGPTRYDP
jgi:uncharacterized protein DUF222